MMLGSIWSMSEATQLIDVSLAQHTPPRKHCIFVIDQTAWELEARFQKGQQNDVKTVLSRL